MSIIGLIKKKKGELTFKKAWFLFLYLCFCKHLPQATNFLFGKSSKKMRYICCKRIFKYCGKNDNNERCAYFGSGLALAVGDNACIVVRCRVQSEIIMLIA